MSTPHTPDQIRERITFLFAVGKLTPDTPDEDIPDLIDTVTEADLTIARMAGGI